MDRRMTKTFFPHLPACSCDLECRLQCHEWSDGRLGCLFGHCSFHELKEAYRQLQNSAQPDDKHIVALLLEIIQAYNDEYNRDSNMKKEPGPGDYGFFVRSVLELQERGKDVLPASLRAELYREAGMFEQCFAFSSHDCRTCDEKEIMDEILFRAAHGDCKPFIIEQCEYYSSKPRMAKRCPCPQFKR